MSNNKWILQITMLPHVPSQSPLLLHLLDALGGQDLLEDPDHILAHRFVAADVQAALLLHEKLGNLLRALLDLVLHVHLLLLLPGERAVQRGENSRIKPRRQLTLVDHVLAFPPAPEKENCLPHLPRLPPLDHRHPRLPLLEEPPEGRDSGARSHHHDRPRRVLGHLEVGPPDEDGDLVSRQGLQGLGLAPREPGARHPLVVPPGRGLAFHERARHVDRLRVAQRRRGDAVESRLELRGDPRCEDPEARLDARELVQQLQQRPHPVENVAPVLVPPLLARQVLEPGLLLGVRGARGHRRQRLLPRRGLKVQEVRQDVPHRHGLALEHGLGELGTGGRGQPDHPLAVVVQALESLGDELWRV
mmetsp:Transcript_7045/g.25500  ORF Transcript_7045/g.25500 Transcript_7045/m.25500 type:complete len:361 (-) Transcript_7045:1069-2151(-)